MERRHGDDDMAGMDMGGAAASGHGSGGMTMMMSVFQTERATPLFSTAWTPGTAGAYAGTVVFLVALAVLFRSLLALKSWRESRWLDAELRRRYVVVPGKLPLAERASRDSLAKHATLTENGVEENVVVVAKNHTYVRPWRLSVDPLRAVVDTVIAGVGYLLYVPPSSSSPVVGDKGREIGVPEG